MFCSRKQVWCLVRENKIENLSSYTICYYYSYHFLAILRYEFLKTLDLIACGFYHTHYNQLIHLIRYVSLNYPPTCSRLKPTFIVLSHFCIIFFSLTFLATLTRRFWKPNYSFEITLDVFKVVFAGGTVSLIPLLYFKKNQFNFNKTFYNCWTTYWKSVRAKKCWCHLLKHRRLLLFYNKEMSHQKWLKADKIKEENLHIFQNNLMNLSQNLRKIVTWK